MRTRRPTTLSILVLTALLTRAERAQAQTSEIEPNGQAAAEEEIAVREVTRDDVAAAGTSAAASVREIAVEAPSKSGKEEAYAQYQILASEASDLLSEVGAAADRGEPAYGTLPSYQRALRLLERLRALSVDAEIPIQQEDLETLRAQIKLLDAYYFPAP